MTKEEIAADKRLQREYGITLGEYDKILAFQGNACAICRRPKHTIRKRLAIDHDHVDGLIRGLLCWNCNKGVLGKARDSLKVLKAAVQYLEYPPAAAALGRLIYTAPGRVGTKKRARLLRDMASNSHQESNAAENSQTGKRSAKRSK